MDEQFQVCFLPSTKIFLPPVQKFILNISSCGSWNKAIWTVFEPNNNVKLQDKKT